MTTPAAPVQSPQFWDAARRHHDDAKHLVAWDRPGSADHLAGFAAECAIKAILIGFLGSQLDSKGMPFSPALQTTSRDRKVYGHGHLPGLWGQLATLANGRVGPVFTGLVAQPNPFTQWDVADRYSDASTINATRVTRHLVAARALCSAYEMAQLTGTGSLA